MTKKELLIKLESVEDDAVILIDFDGVLCEVRSAGPITVEPFAKNDEIVPTYEEGVSAFEITTEV